MTTEILSKNLEQLADPKAFRGPINIDGIQVEKLISELQQLILIRVAEEKIGDEFGSGNIKCPCHLVIGQEVPALGIATQIRKGDRVFGAHRSHAHYLALGGDLHKLFAEVLGKETGCSKGMGGSMHLMDRDNGLYGTVPIVGGTIPIATGAALASKLDRDQSVAVSFLGDGATEEGAFHESLNFASVFKLPVVYVVENNLFSSHLHISLRQPFDSVCRYAESHGVTWQRVDGNDLIEMNNAVTSAFDNSRQGKGPQFIEAVTYRWRGHVGHSEDSDVGVARKEGLLEWKKRDPIRRLFEGLNQAGHLEESQLEDFYIKARETVSAAWKLAEADPYPDESALLSCVYGD